MASQHGCVRETGMRDQTPTHRRWIRRIVLGLAVTAIIAPTAHAIDSSSTGSAVQYVPVCGPMWYGGALDSVGGNGPATRYRPVCGPMGYGGAPSAVGVNGLSAAVFSAGQGADAPNPLPVPSTERGIDWRDAGAGVGIGVVLGLLAAGAALALKRRRRSLVGV